MRKGLLTVQLLNVAAAASAKLDYLESISSLGTAPASFWLVFYILLPAVSGLPPTADPDPGLMES